MRVLLLSILVAACSAPAPVADPPNATVDDELALARAKWTDAGFETYEMTLTRSCFCPPEWRGPFTVAVEDGAVTEALYEGKPSTAGEPPTVEALFELLETAYAEGAARVDVTYHDDYGYPISLFIDQDERMADEEIGYEVSELIRR